MVRIINVINIKVKYSNNLFKILGNNEDKGIDNKEPSSKILV